MPNEWKKVPGGRIPYLIGMKDDSPFMRHRDIKLWLIRLTERPNRHAGNDLVDSLRLAYAGAAAGRPALSEKYLIFAAGEGCPP
jgi:hypothetical protein